MIIVRVYKNPGVYTQTEEEQHESGYHIVTTDAGVLQVRSVMGEVLKAYAPGVWVEAHKTK